jgi:peptide/nickel transport system permease protein
MNLLDYIVKRLLLAIPTLLIVSFISFTIMRYDVTLPAVYFHVGNVAIGWEQPVRLKSPIDPLAELRQNPQISKAAYQQEVERLGLDKPFLVQYGLWLKNILSLPPNLGLSFSGEEVSKLIAQRLPNTILLNVLVLLATWSLALPMGVYAAVHWRSKADSLMTFLSSVSMGLPTFIMALLLALICVKLNLLPVGGLTSENFDEMNLFQKIGDLARHLTLPVLVLTLSSLAGLQRQMRGNLLEVLGANYIRTARAKGLPENKVIYKHALRCAINPMITLMGFEFASLFSGAALVEMILRYPGIGFLALEGVRQSDTNLVMVILVMGSMVLILGNLLADIALRFADPRIRAEGLS